MGKKHRISEPSEHEDVQVYRFSTEAISEVPSEIQSMIDRYNELHRKSAGINATGEKIITTEQIQSGERLINDEEIQEISSLRLSLRTYFEDAMQSEHWSVLGDSVGEGSDPWNSGQDSHVFESSSKNRVFKYSVPGKPSSPEAVIYLRKKYKLLQHYLGELVPQSAFFLGERKKGFRKKKPEQSFDSDIRCITIQKKAEGKTFQEMTDEEKRSQVVVDGLRKAHKKYIQAKKEVKEACQRLGLPDDTIDIKLDIGSLSNKNKKDEIDESLIYSFQSPNVVCNPETGEIRFIDFGSGEWSDDKEAVFQTIIKD